MTDENTSFLINGAEDPKLKTKKRKPSCNTIRVLPSLLISVFICVAFMGNMNRLIETTASLATLPILFSGASEAQLIMYNNTIEPTTYIINDTSPESSGTCTGIWSCSELLCNLYTPDIAYIAVLPNDNPTDIVCGTDNPDWLDQFPEYHHIEIAIKVVWVCLALNWAINLFTWLASCFMKTFPKRIFWIIYAILFILRSPVYYVIGYFHINIVTLQVDDPPQSIQKAENILFISFIITYVLDHVYNTYEILEKIFQSG